MADNLFSFSSNADKFNDALSSKPKFEFKESPADDKLVITIFGEKGSGKTMTACGLPGLKVVLCFDFKAQVIKEHFFKNDTNVKVYDAVEYLIKDPEEYLNSSETTYEYVMFILDNIKKMKPDWLIIDGLEIVSNVCEMVMRKHNGLRPYQGIANMGVWKERRQLLDAIHRKAIQCVTKGIVYTTYCDEEKIVEDGAIIISRKVPKWTDTVLYVTDVTLHVENKVDKNGCKVMLKVNNSKIPGFLKTGEVIDITNKKLDELIKR